MQHKIYLYPPVGSNFACGNIANVADRCHGVGNAAAQQGERNNAEHKEPWTDHAPTMHGHIGNQGRDHILQCVAQVGGQQQWFTSITIRQRTHKETTECGHNALNNLDG